VKRGKQKTFLYLIAVFWLLLTGICMDSSQAYSVLAFQNAEESSTYFYRSTNSVSTDVICTSDLLGQRTVVETARALDGPTVKGRNSLRAFCAVPALISGVSNFYSGMVPGRREDGLNSHVVIMRYIHNKDGRKS
jgi:hypothetical protein